MAPARIEQPRVPETAEQAAKAPWVCRNMEARRLDRAPSGRSSAYEPTKGPGAPDHSSAMEAEAPAYPAGPGRAHRLDAVLVRQGRARALRAVLDLHGPLLCRPLETLGLHRTVFRSRNHRARRPDPDAGVGGAGISRDRRRRLAEKIRSRGVISRSLRQSDRQPGHQAQ